MAQPKPKPKPPATAPATAEESAPSSHGFRIARLRVRHLQLLDRIDKTGSLSAAAASLHVSQPRATNMLRELEEALGCLLLERSSRGTRLNEAGTIALDRLRIALGALDAAETALRNRTPRVIVRIGVLPLVGTDRLCRVIAELEADGVLPQVILRVGTVGELLSMLHAGEVDAVISSLDTSRPATPAGDRLRVVKLWEEHLRVVAAKANPLARKRKVSLEDLLQHPWVLMAGRSANRQGLERLFLQAGLHPPEPQVETESPHICLAMVAATRMIALVPDSAYRLAADRVSEVKLDGRFPSTWTHFITLGDVPMLPHVEQLARRLGAGER
ncbi:MAG: LysR family transcriptional regulator [Gammaproteobacteria bacterium]|nr:LysR family transcriptional regulator [Gammaproteobacteria bacterium]